MRRREVVEIIANEVIGLRWDIEELSLAIEKSNGDKYAQEQHRDCIIADRTALTALRNISRKLGIWEEVDRLASDEEAR